MRFGQRVGRQLLALSMLLTSQAHASLGEKQYPNVEETNRIAHSLLSVLRNCPNRIWPNLKAGTMDMLLVNKELSNQIIISAQNNRISTIPNESLPPHMFSSAFSFNSYAYRSLMHVDTHLGKDYPNARSIAFELAIHEAFHHMDQAGWTRKENSTRGTTIPLLTSPRIARNMLYRNLLAAYHHKSETSTYLGKAKYWHEQWLKADATEGDSTTDGYEGTARYAELIAKLLDDRGCGTTEQELERLAVQSDVFQGANAIGFQSLDSEGYYMGGLASLILRFQFPNLNWHDRIVKGETPVEILLDKVRPVADSVDPNVEREIRAAIKERSLTVDKYLASANNQMQKKTSIYVTLPLSTLKGSFSPYGFFNGRASGIQYTPMAQELTFSFTDGTQFHSEKDAVFIYLPDNSPCQRGWTFVIDEAELHSRGNNKFEVTSPLFNGPLTARQKTDSDGRQWLCAFEYQSLN